MLELSKQDVGRAFLAYQLESGSVSATLQRLRSVQFDPLSPIGCNHDLVLQARVPGYRIGDWGKVAYEDRLAFDGWDKQASIIAMDGWPLRRIMHRWHASHFAKVFTEYQPAVDAMLAELRDRGPLLPREFTFQERNDSWTGSWYGPSVTKRILRALWHTGRVMTSGRQAGHHVYDLTERIVPAELLHQPELDEMESATELMLDRHRSMGLIQPNASYEMWGTVPLRDLRKAILPRLIEEGRLVPVNVDGVKANATPGFLEYLGRSPEPRVRFVAPLDQILWDRKMVHKLFGFEYFWEVYKPAAQRRWGYYVLPILFGDRFVGRCELWSRKGEIEVRAWHWEEGQPAPELWEPLREALGHLMRYAGATKLNLDAVESGLRKQLMGLKAAA